MTSLNSLHSPRFALLASLLAGLLVLAGCNSESGPSRTGAEGTPPPTLIPPEPQNQLFGWIGADSSDLEIELIRDEPAEFYATSDPNCDYDASGICATPETVTDGSIIIEDTHATLSQTGYYQLRQGNQTANTRISTEFFSARSAHAMAVFNNQLWVIGGQDDGGQTLNDVWSSSDGVSWRQRTEAAEFVPRQPGDAVVFNELLWLFSGWDNGRPVEDIWVSDNGTTWVRKDTPQTFNDYYGGRVVVFDAGLGEQLWRVGATHRNDGSRNNVLVSSNGIDWEVLTNDAAFGDHDGELVVFDAGDGQGRQLWRVGGENQPDTIWASSDGIVWKKITSSAGFGARYATEVVAFDDGQGEQLWLIGGYDYQYNSENDAWAFKDVWVSKDGKRWTQKTPDAGFPARYGHQAVVFNAGTGNRIWLTAGDNNDGIYYSDVWSSGNGADWQSHNVMSLYPDSSVNHQLLTYDDGTGAQLWLFTNNTIFTSTQGLKWNLRNDNPAYGKLRHDSQVVAFNDGQGERLWLVGGNMLGRYDAKLWASRDGLRWEKITPKGNGFSAARKGHQLLVFNNGVRDQLMLIGGVNATSKHNDVWVSTNGIDWEQIATGERFSPRHGHQVVAFGDGLWLFGGTDDNGIQGDIWFSADGKTWEKKAGDAYGARTEHQVVPYNDGVSTKLIMIGGYGSDAENKNDVWTSPNGTDWTQYEHPMPFTARSTHQVAPYFDPIGKKYSLLLVGGGSNRPSEYSTPAPDPVWRSTTHGASWEMGVKVPFHFQPNPIDDE
ncbi:hypothetical protein BGP77_12040 [Saccharospirillum sp. MSK14-1]|uniref:hypothetical protein n=1 Tax=Saccharospirillum sp. MSK14-1 TaxID=1897632 RepID=UPI000D4927EC|nr:hypothetical protein [Saccharospirillum sp. MSK14-1]PTY38435.1 hypothetical protein BGP77_12040 [Saccharospirillum sp. MSK14-1]